MSFRSSCKVNLKGAFAAAVQQDFERRVHVDMIDPRCVVTTTSEVATLDLATLSLEALSTNGVKVCVLIPDAALLRGVEGFGNFRFCQLVAPITIQWARAYLTSAEGFNAAIILSSTFISVLHNHFAFAVTFHRPFHLKLVPEAWNVQ